MFAVRDLTQYAELLQVHEVQQQVWGFTQGEGLYPPMLKTAAENGGTIIGAFDGAKMIGFLFGFIGLHTDRRIKLCSQTMGILPEYRNKGVAATLKWAQRERVLANEIDLITWTYDPLEAPNARLNVHTLGGVAHVIMLGCALNDINGMGTKDCFGRADGIRVAGPPRKPILHAAQH